MGANPQVPQFRRPCVHFGQNSFQLFRMGTFDMKPQILFVIVTFLAIETFEFILWKMLLFDMLDDLKTVEGHLKPGPFNPRLFNHELFIPIARNFMVENSRVEKFMVEKFGVERSEVKAWC